LEGIGILNLKGFMWLKMDFDMDVSLLPGVIAGNCTITPQNKTEK
jgi:hypothetical protein